MSFTTDVAEELLTLPTGKTCCRKALLFGLFFGGKSKVSNNIVTSTFKYQDTAKLACDLLSKQFSTTAEIEESILTGRRIYIVKTASKALVAFINETIRESERMLGDIAGFRCENCIHEFLRGVFLSSATVNDPRKGYHLEFSFESEPQADKFSRLLESEMTAPKKIFRAKRVGIYYKGNGIIGDLLYYIGATKSSFDFANVCIERDIRNLENRATNCVARNISRSVSASQKHIAAIEYIESCHKMSGLSEELQYTARLRREYDSASLSELAMLHNPPITKSGLNRRLNQLLIIADELKEDVN